MNPLAAVVVKIRKRVEKLANLALFLGMGWVIVMMLLTTVDVSGRFLFSAPVPGSIELGEFMLAIFGILGMAYTHFAGSNVRVTMLTRILPPRIEALISALTGLMSLVIMAMLCWYGGVSAVEEFHFGTTTDNLGLPVYPLYWLLSVGAGLLGLVILVRLMEDLLEAYGIAVKEDALS